MTFCQYYDWCPTRQTVFPDSRKGLEEKYCSDLQDSEKCQTNNFLTDELSRPDSCAHFERDLSRARKDLSRIQ